MIDAIITGSEGFIGKKLVTSLRNKKLNLLPLSSKNFNILNLGLTEIDLRNSNKIVAKINIDKKLIFKNKRS